jgi:imidazolonepropionase-like amidohydrolase
VRRRRFEEELALVGVLHKNGIPIVAGTDQSVPGFSLHREIELYVDAGFTPLEALQAATIVPARVMGKESDSGTIEAGKRGDLVILDASPLDNIANTRKIYRVITNGRVFDPAPLWESVGFTP